MKWFLPITFSLIALFIVAQAFRSVVYRPLEIFAQSRMFDQEDLYQTFVLGQDGKISASNLPLPALSWVFGFSVIAILVLLVWAYNLTTLEEGGFKWLYFWIFVINGLWWAYLFPEISFEIFFGKINYILINLVKVPL